MAERWTMKQLDSMSDLRFAHAILSERLNRLSNPYSPLARRLYQVANMLFDLAVEREMGEARKKSLGPFLSCDEAFEALGWWCNKYSGGTLEIGKHSPAGEDFFFSIEGKDTPQEVADYARDFDKDEHIEMWVENRGKRGVPESIRELVDDADAIQEMLIELADALKTVPERSEGHGN